MVDRPVEIGSRPGEGDPELDGRDDEGGRGGYQAQVEHPLKPPRQPRLGLPTMIVLLVLAIAAGTSPSRRATARWGIR